MAEEIKPTIPPTSYNDVFKTLTKNYHQVRKLLDDDKDAETTPSQPYKSKYAALKILEAMRDSLLTLDNSHEDKVAPLLGVIHLNIGILHIETDDLHAGEQNLAKCVSCLSARPVQPESVLALLSALNQLGIVWSNREESAKAQVFLERAENAYKEYKKTTTAIPVNMSELFGVPCTESAQDMVESLHTLTLYYLAQIYSALGQYSNSTLYCHATLRRQLDRKVLNSIDWALNAATLSQCFVGQGQYTLARHHLGAATYILQQHKKWLEANKKKLGEEALAAEWETFNHRSADVARCWAKYGIQLMSSSRERLLERSEEEDKEDEDKEVEDGDKDAKEKSPVVEPTREDLKFSKIENEVEKIVEGITDAYLLDFNDAAAVFKNTRKWLDEAKTYYTLENHASDYVQIMQDLSQAYKYLAFFEEDEGRRAKMHKRRVDILENLVKALNPRYYMAACRAIWMELGETYSEMRDIKFDRLTNEEKPPMHLATKVNHLANEAIRNFELFLDSMNEYKNSEGVVKFPEELTRPALLCYFNIGRLYYQMCNQDKQTKLENTRKILKASMFLVNYCEKDSAARDLMVKELKVSKALVKLLPSSIRNLEV